MAVSKLDESTPSSAFPGVAKPRPGWEMLKDWEEIAESSQGRSYLLSRWVNASDNERAQMPESLQLKITTFLDSVCLPDFERMVMENPQKWRQDYERLWVRALSVWPEVIDQPSGTMNLAVNWMKLDSWERTVKQPSGRLYVMWRYLNAKPHSKNWDAMPEKLLATMKVFLGGSRVLQRQLYMRYHHTSEEKWEPRLEREWEDAMARGLKEAKSILAPTLVKADAPKLQTDTRNRLKEILDGLKELSSSVAEKA